MIEEFKYRPPLKYLLVGISILIASFIFGMATIKGGEIWYIILVGIFCLLTLATGVAFLTLYFRKLNAGNLKLGDDFIEIPGRWKERVRLEMNEITDIGEIDTYDNVIEIQCKDKVHLIERNWMDQSDFDRLKKILHKSWINQNN